MDDGHHSVIARELRLIRLGLFGLLAVATVWAVFRVSEAVVRPPAPNGQELRDIQVEL